MHNGRYERGDIVNVSSGLYLGKAVVEYNYNERYGDPLEPSDSHSVVFLDTGSSLAWVRSDGMEFVGRVDGNDIFRQCAETKKRITEQETDITYIAPRLDTGELSSTSIEYLFSLIGYTSRLHQHGEFYALYEEWQSLYPIMKFVRDAETLSDAKIVTPTINGVAHDVTKLWQSFHPVEDAIEEARRRV